MSNVYFTNMRAQLGDSLLEKLRRLVIAAGIKDIDFTHKYVAIKLHFGEPGNLAFLRPNYAKVIADLVKECGGRPFLTDCNTLYVGRRKNALDHIDSAYENGYTPFSTGCHIIIADGIKGLDEVAVPVPNGELCKEARIGRAVMDADIVISLSHFKGHEEAGFGGALKNVGMGCGSRTGKMDMHSNGKVKVSKSRCIACGACARVCAHDAPQVTDTTCVIDREKCVGCGRCLANCPVDAIYAAESSANTHLSKKIAEYSAAVLMGRPHFHISLVIDVSPYCDCHGDNDAPIVPDIGMFASFDPVALDMACADAVNAQAPIENSLLGEAKHVHNDHFKNIFPVVDWRAGLSHAEKLGLGTQDYTIVTVK
ncbi:DUF362 domain-containing protein [Christensenellaceae bacterium OttesenSCG-928-L17]|nr:DUF362 domain-containing protein [Christensenellaceae bacterium OttesenSCG-928-L17]